MRQGFRPPLRGSRDSQVYSAGNEEYETSKMAYRDIKNSVDTAKREGLAEGIEIGMNQKAQDIAKNMLAMGLSAEQVAKATQLSLEIIKNLSNS